MARCCVCQSQHLHCYAARDFENAAGGVYFYFSNVFAPLVSGPDPFKLAKAHMEDNAEVMLWYFSLYVAAWSSTKEYGQSQVRKMALGSEDARQTKAAYVGLIIDIESLRFRPFQVLTPTISTHSRYCCSWVPVIWNLYPC